jgi:hypothetical protein
LTLEAVAALESGRTNGEGVFLSAQALVRANDDYAHLFMVQKRSFGYDI